MKLTKWFFMLALPVLNIGALTPSNSYYYILIPAEVSTTTAPSNSINQDTPLDYVTMRSSGTTDCWQRYVTGNGDWDLGPHRYVKCPQ